MSAALRVGEMFAGYGGLGMGLAMVTGTRTAWVADIEPGPRAVLAHRFPGVPNLGDVTAVDWAQVEPVDTIIGGSPCQDLSTAGTGGGCARAPGLVCGSPWPRQSQSSGPHWSCGRTCQEPSVHQPIARWNPDRDVWEAGQGDLFSGLPDVFSETWPSSGMTRNGRLFAPATSAPRTRGPASSCLPTPRASLGASQTETARLLPTPTALEGKGPGGHGTGGANLRTVVVSL